MYQSKIIGTGFYVPDNVVTNDDLSKIMDTNDAWIQERTGIKERRWIKDGSGESTTSMAFEASKNAIKNAGIDKDDIDFIIFATLSPDYYFPGGGVQIQDLLDIPTVGALDVRNQCSGFIYAMSVADQFIKTGMYKNILVIGSEYHSGGIDKSTRGRGISVLFGDGAGAVILSRSDKAGQGLLSTHLHSQGKFADKLIMEGPSTKHWVPKILEANDPDDESYFPHMDGQLVFKNAVVRFSEAIYEGLEANKLNVENIDMLVPHQANLRISQFIQRKFKLNDDQVFNNIMKYGNTTAASIPIALAEAVEQGKIKEGDLVVLAAFGSGFTWGSVIMRW
jgi:3-oxoacyl-[acyl-carrier-protein] synthase-3